MYDVSIVGGRVLHGDVDEGREQGLVGCDAVTTQERALCESKVAGILIHVVVAIRVAAMIITLLLSPGCG